MIVSGAEQPFPYLEETSTAKLEVEPCAVVDVVRPSLKYGCDVLNANLTTSVNDDLFRQQRFDTFDVQIEPLLMPGLNKGIFVMRRVCVEVIAASGAVANGTYCWFVAQRPSIQVLVNQLQRIK